jgi:NAD(P)-dependent dehydrogenase (short-subunit alcohol dehydrogenase family)
VRNTCEQTSPYAVSGRGAATQCGGREADPGSGRRDRRSKDRQCQPFDLLAGVSLSFRGLEDLVEFEDFAGGHDTDEVAVINIASLGADRALDRYPLAAYSAAKAGVVAITRSLASEWGQHGVRVNAIGPAFFPTRLSGFLEDPEQVAWITRHTALRRPARLDELNGAVVFLASDASSYLTGQHLYVDGGWSVY